MLDEWLPRPGFESPHVHCSGRLVVQTGMNGIDWELVGQQRYPKGVCRKQRKISNGAYNAPMALAA